MFEEFDYSLDKDSEQNLRLKIKKTSLLAGFFIAFLLFIYVLISAYKFVTYKPAIKDVPLIKAETDEIKTLSDSKAKMIVDNLDIEVYDVLEKKTSDTKREQKILENKALLENIKKNQAKAKAESVKRAQIVALKTREKAIEFWRILKSRHGSLVSGKQYFIEEVNLGMKGKFYRLQVGEFETSKEVKDFCGKYIKATSNNKVDCILIEIK